MTDADSLISGGGETSLPQGNSVITSLPPDIYIQTDKAKSHQKYRKDLRDKAIFEFGGKCIQCGFSDYRALQFDHIKGGGVKHLKESGANPTYYKMVIENKSKFQLLCANCNWIKRSEAKELRGVGKINSINMRRYWDRVKSGEISGPRNRKKITRRTLEVNPDDFFIKKLKTEIKQIN